MDITYYRFYVTLVFDHANVGTTIVIDKNDENDAIEQGLDALFGCGITHPEPRAIYAELLDIVEE